MKDWKRVAKFVWVLAFGSSLAAVACGGDEGFTPVCPTIDDCVTPPTRPSSDAGASDDASNGDEDGSTDEATE